MNQMFKCKFSSIRKVLNKTSAKKTRLEVKMNRLHQENINLKNNFEKKAAELSVAQSFETKYNVLQSEFKALVAEQKKSLVIDIENDAYCKSTIQHLPRHLEAEVLTRVKNKRKSTIPTKLLRADSMLIEQLHQSDQTNVEPQWMKENSIEEEYGNKLKNSLYQLQIHQLNSVEDKPDCTIEEIRNANNEILALNAIISVMEAQISSCQLRIGDLESLIENEIYRDADEDMTQQCEGHDDFRDIDVTTDLEMATYSSLLASEKKRLKNSFSNGNDQYQIIKQEQQTPEKRGIKRKCTTSLDDEINEIESPIHSIVCRLSNCLDHFSMNFRSTISIFCRTFSRKLILKSLFPSLSTKRSRSIPETIECFYV